MRSDGVAVAYSATGAAWTQGPDRVYDALAAALVVRCPATVVQQRVLDLGAGTGAASRAALAAGASAVVAVDVAAGMLSVNACNRPPAACADARALPFPQASFGAVIAAFSLNHLADPRPAMAEARRVLRPGGGFVVSAYADDDHHQVKETVERVCASWGWRPEPWYVTLRAEAMPLLATPEKAIAVADDAGLTGATAELVRVRLPELDADALVAWRLGMAHLAPFVQRLIPADRVRLAAEARRGLGDDAPPLVRSFVVLTWTAP